MKKIISAVLFGLFLLACSSFAYEGSWNLVGSGESVIDLISFQGNLYSCQAIGNTSQVLKKEGTDWSVVGQISQIGSVIYLSKMAADQTNLYVIGNFANPIHNRIAKWDGANWSVLGDTASLENIFDGLDIAFDHNHNILYAVGQLYLPKTNSWKNCLAKWNGSAWEPLGVVNDTGWANGNVEKIVIDNSGNVIVGGRFTNIGGVTCNHIAKWDVSSQTFSDLGSGISAQGVFSISDLAFDPSGNLFAAADLPGTSINIYQLYKLTGSAWSSFGNPANGAITSIAFSSAGEMIVGGWFDRFDINPYAPGVSSTSVLAKRIAKWDGSSMQNLGSGIPDCKWVNKVLFVGNTLYVGAVFNSPSGIFQWIESPNGSTSTIMGTTTTVGSPAATTTVTKPLPSTTLSSITTTTVGPVTSQRFSMMLGVQVGKADRIDFYPSKTAINPSPSLIYMPIRLFRNGKYIPEPATNAKGIATLAGVMAGDTLQISKARTGKLFTNNWEFKIPAPAWGAMVTLKPLAPVKPTL